jgi:hypothetical protein
MSAINIIQRVARKLLTQNQPKGVITIPNRMTAEAKAGEIAATLQRAGLSMNRFDDFITSETDLIRLLNQIEAFEKNNLADNIRSGIRNTESAKVFDLKGKQIKNTDNIMGGEEMPPPGSRGGPDDIAAPVQSAEETLKNMTEAEIKANLEAQNRSAVENILKRKNREDVYGIEDYDTTNMSEIKKEIIRTETKLGNLNPDDPNFRAKAKPLVDKIEALKNKMRDDKADGGRIGFFKGAVAGGGNISPGTDTKGNVRDDNPFTGGGGGNNNNQPPPKKTLTTTQTKDDTKKNVLKTVGSFAFNRFLNSMGVPTKDIQKALAIKGILEQAGNVIFPEGDLQNIKATSPDQRTYNIEATKDMVENLPGGLVKDIVAPAGALVMSPVYDTFQGIQRGLEDPNKGILQAIKDENILSSAVERFTGAAAPLAERFEEGGIARIGLKDGMNRRTFLKLFSGLVSLPIIGKVLKPLKVGKTVTKVPIIKTDNVAGKPEWFDQLVNKVILEGDDVSKRFATKDREIVHMKKLDEDTTVRVTQDLDEGAVKVDYENPENVYGDPVQLRYKKPNPDEGDPRPSAEFDTAESGPVGRAFGPDDYEIEIDELGGTSISDLTSDVSKLKEYATGKKQTLKEFVQSKKRKDKAARISEGGEDEMQAVIDRQGEFIQFDDVYPEQDFAKGGIARMLGE